MQISSIQQIFFIYRKFVEKQLSSSSRRKSDANILNKKDITDCKHFSQEQKEIIKYAIDRSHMQTWIKKIVQNFINS